MTLQCPAAPACNRTFPKPGNLKQHTKKCSILQERRTRAKQLRQEFAKRQPLERMERWQIIEPSTDPIPFETMMDIELPEPPSIPPPAKQSVSGRPQHQYQMPRRHQDLVPEPVPSQSLVAPPHLPETVPSNVARRVILHVLDRVDTAANAFGIWRHFPRRPTLDPDKCLPAEELALIPLVYKLLGPVAQTLDSLGQHLSKLKPAVRMLMAWANNGQTVKSYDQITELVQNVLLAKDFDPQDLIGFDIRSESTRLDAAVASSETRSPFTETAVPILLPSGIQNVPPIPYFVTGLLHRPLTSIISEAFAGPLGHLHHLSPFVLKRTSPATLQDERLVSEVYNSDEFLKVHDHIQKHGLLPPEDSDCRREKVVAALQPLSDATHFTNFGNAKCWPFYLMFGNVSKYVRAIPSSGAIHHLAYIPMLPDSFKDFAAKHHPKWKSQKADILTHCRRELLHAVWNHILDDDFIRAYKYGMVVRCSDGVERRIYPRFFTYSADYPEKVLIATIRDKGLFPCPRCMVQQSQLDLMGLKRDIERRFTKFRVYLADLVDLARQAIHRFGYAIKSKRVEDILKPYSAVPTQNAFVHRLGLDFNPSRMLAPDLLHEFELGVWKSLFTHLIRVLYASASGSDELVNALDLRYRQIPTFGGGTIRNFADNSSEMKKLAARDFEDLLQCAIPVFEGLLPDEHNRRLIKLLYRLAEWHSLAKMRIHSEESLRQLEELTTELGKLMRTFRDLTCNQFNTKELPREVEARNRREAQQANNTLAPAPSANESGTLPDPAATRSKSGPKPKTLNLFTVKWHFLGDYVEYIKQFGTTDGYSTQLGELAHRTLKAFYRMTNKKDANMQIAKKYNRMNVLNKPNTASFDPQTKAELAEAAAAGLDSNTHYISISRNKPVPIFAFVQDGDPAKKDFYVKLQDHLLGRLTGRAFDGDTEMTYTDADRNMVHIVNNTIFRVQTARINYTTYDMQRSYDTINPRNHRFIMVLSPETERGAHPFWYAAVMGIFHAQVFLSGSFSPQRIEFLWVRWLGVEPGHRFGRKLAKLPKLGFVPDEDEFAYGFLDPSLVIRGCHLIPAFVEGRTNELLSTNIPTEARCPEEVDDWANYYVNLFVDRDMMSRHFGIGVGHSLLQQPLDSSTVDADANLEEEGDEEDAYLQRRSGFDVPLEESDFDDEHSADSDNSDLPDSGGEDDYDDF